MALCYPDTVIWPDPDVAASPDVSVQQLDLALSYAWSTLQVLTAYQIATCPVTVRPCGAGCDAWRGSYYIAPVGGPYGGASWWPAQSGGDIVNVLLRDCEGCGWVNEVILPGPVGAIESVVVDGETLDPALYRVDNGNKLVREDGIGWPTHQDFNLPAGAVGTFTVTYYHGATGSDLVRYAAGILASEYLKALNDQDCALPPGTTQMVRQGLTIEIEKDMFENGLTGIKLVDDVTGAYNPFRQKMPAQVFSLDRLPARQTTIPPYRVG